MGKTYEELMGALSPERRARVEARTAELIAEEKCLPSRETAPHTR